ncbi:DegV family protein [Romboutsia ilealis]|uniref:DegV family protein n=1 Tax=Romboutsia faecis TaxID=2764597 RepID=A0ABR7JMP1_9FIRM|nr:DegV family protein [Romboutsia faecis]MBC5996189.1 DegV family protein [Romboutsia faecis]MRN25167.1 DegV family protein [Romboutsia ilealis]
MKIKLICDSLCDTPEELVEKYDIDIVPLNIILGDKEYKEGIDISNEEFYKRMKEKTEVPKTSQATYIQFKEVFDKYKDEYSIVCINGSSKSSGTYQSAVMAKNDTDGDIHVFDTLTLSLGSAQFVVKACELIENDKNIKAEELIKHLEELRESVSLFFVPDTLEYLQRSGRASLTTATIGNLLKIKPIFTVEDANIFILNKVRGKKHAIHELVNLVINKYDTLEDKNIIIGCGDNVDDFEKLKDEVNTKIKCKKLYFTRGGACICSHTGPDIFAISCSY